MNVKYIISLSALIALMGTSCWASWLKTGYDSPNQSLFRAVRADDIKGLNIALKAGADVNSKDDTGDTPLILAITRALVPYHTKERENFIDALLANNNINRNEPDREGETALMHAQEEFENSDDKEYKNFYKQIIKKLQMKSNSLAGG